MLPLLDIVYFIYFIYDEQNKRFFRVMNKITSTQAKQEFGDVIIRSQISPISVTKNGKPVIVILSETEYQAMKLQNLRSALIEGEQSGDAGELNMQAIKNKARKLLNESQDI